MAGENLKGINYGKKKSVYITGIPKPPRPPCGVHPSKEGNCRLQGKK